ncbi:MAG TPA: hypothetical protein VHY84_00520 [Bryobacteraceae bacterium]|nr:hypothetical protein [Bryobacteraceae bacterium]
METPDPTLQGECGKIRWGLLACLAVVGAYLAFFTYNSIQESRASNSSAAVTRSPAASAPLADPPRPEVPKPPEKDSPEAGISQADAEKGLRDAGIPEAEARRVAKVLSGQPDAQAHSADTCFFGRSIDAATELFKTIPDQLEYTTSQRAAGDGSADLIKIEKGFVTGLQGTVKEYNGLLPEWDKLQTVMEQARKEGLPLTPNASSGLQNCGPDASLMKAQLKTISQITPKLERLIAMQPSQRGPSLKALQREMKAALESWLKSK